MAPRSTFAQTPGLEAPKKGRRSLIQEIVRKPDYQEGLAQWRFCLVLLSFAPLFLLLAIRGNEVLNEWWTWGICLTLIVVPLVMFSLRILSVWRSNSVTTISVGSAEESNGHILAYLFATLLPFYRSSLDTWRDMVAIAIALALIVGLFWHLRLHYINLLLAIFHYQVFTVYPPKDASPYARQTPCMVLTKRRYLKSGDTLATKRVSDNLYWDTDQ